MLEKPEIPGDDHDDVVCRLANIGCREGVDSVPCVWLGLVVATAPLALGVGMHGCARSLISVARHA